MLTAAEAESTGDVSPVAWAEAKRLRELLKFEFFFPARREFETELRTELALLTPDLAEGFTAADARRLLARTRPHLAHLVLRPFLDAYHVVADRLAAASGEPVEEAELLSESLRVGRQWELQRRIASAESVSLELFRTAVRLAAHRGLLATTGDGAALADRRQAFLAEIRHTAERIAVIAAFARDADAVPAGASRPAPGVSR